MPIFYMSLISTIGHLMAIECEYKILMLHSSFLFLPLGGTRKASLVTVRSILCLFSFSRNGRQVDNSPSGELQPSPMNTCNMQGATNMLPY